MKKLLLFILLFIALDSGAQNQGINNIWLMGYDSEWGLPFGMNHIDFITGSPVINYDSIAMEFNHTHANISDSNGDLLFYTNGYYIADASNDTMMNGTGINPGAYANFVPEGFLIPQGALIIKKPGSDSLYYLIHCTADNYPTGNGSISFFLYLTVVDMSANNGLGAVISKNQILISDSLNIGKITACKHANGRDWWVMCHRVNSNMYYKLLFTPDNAQPQITTQYIGVVRQWDNGQAKFSPDGNKYAYFHIYNGLEVYDFDRCSGMLSNPVRDTTLPYYPGNMGCEFSPNSNILYVGNIMDVYQYDLNAANILASRTTVASYDGFYDQAPGLGTYLCYPQLAPDGKIYITTGNGTHYMHTINYPDSVGMGCDVAQHSLQLPAYYFNTLPNPPNSFLGAVLGSPCDSLPHVGISESTPRSEAIKIFSNPNDGHFTLWFNVHDKQGLLQVYDVNGNLIFKDEVAQWSQYKHVDISKQPAGIYFVKMSWGRSEASVKVMVEH